MFGIGIPELILILIVGLIVFGPGKLPEVGRAFGKGLREFKKAQNALTAAMNEPEPAGKPALTKEQTPPPAAESAQEEPAPAAQPPVHPAAAAPEIQPEAATQRAVAAPSPQAAEAAPAEEGIRLQPVPTAVSEGYAPPTQESVRAQVAAQQGKEQAK